MQIDHYTIDAIPALSVLGIGEYIPLETIVVDTLKGLVGEDGKIASAA